MTISRLALGCVLAAFGSTFVAAAETPSRIVSWNAYSIQFIDPPAFQLLALPDTVAYQAIVEQGDRKWQVQSKHPRLDLASIWPEMPVRRFSLTLHWLDAQGKVLATEKSSRVKAPDWQGLQEPPADWVGCADRNIAYLIRVADEGPAPYREPGVPAWIWSIASPAPAPTPRILGPGFTNPSFRREFEYRHQRWPNGLDVGFPGCIIPAMIYGMTAHAQSHRPQAQRAMELARAAADWTLKNHLPNSGALPKFPYSTITNGRFGGYVEGESVTVLRASWIGLSLVHLYEATKDQKYLDYARHLATVTARFLAPDGSSPYRINLKTGAVTEAFCTGGIQFSILVEALRPHGVDPKLLMASERAIQWMNAYPAQTNNWQGGYEDVGECRPYRNLTHWEAQLLIQYLCRNKDVDPGYLPLAKRLLRFVEDQFVIFGPESQSHPVPIKGPMVFEQYVCWYPMEGHTGYYIWTLIELHKATGDRIYLEKARAAANAICAQQCSNGAISNWGTRWLENGKPTGEDSGHTWYNTNAIASASLYRLAEYCRGLEAR